MQLFRSIGANGTAKAVEPGRTAVICGLAAMLMICSPALYAQAQKSVTTTLKPNFAPQAEVSVSPSTVTLTTSGTTFQAYAGALNLYYCIRTSSSGSGSITVAAGGDFSPSGGPTIANLTYTTAVSGTGTGQSGTISSSSTSVVSVAGAASTASVPAQTACTTANSSSATVSFSLLNSPTYSAGTKYQVLLTFTISAS